MEPHYSLIKKNFSLCFFVSRSFLPLWAKAAEILVLAPSQFEDRSGKVIFPRNASHSLLDITKVRSRFFFCTTTPAILRETSKETSY